MKLYQTKICNSTYGDEAAKYYFDNRYTPLQGMVPPTSLKLFLKLSLKLSLKFSLKLSLKLSLKFSLKLSLKLSLSQP